MAKFKVEKVTIHTPGWLKVYIEDDTQIKYAQSRIDSLKGIKNVNITEKEDLRRDLTVQVEPTCSLDEAKEMIEADLSKNL